MALYDDFRDQIRNAMAPVRDSEYEFQRNLFHDLTLVLVDLPIKKLIGLTISILIITLTTHIRTKRQSLRYLGLPIIKPPKDENYTALLDETSESPFLLNHAGSEYIVFPHSMWDEIKRLPKAKAFVKHVLLGEGTTALHRCLGTDLTNAIPVRTQAQYQTAKLATKRALGACAEWKSFRMGTLRDIIATMSAVGLLGGTDPRWRGVVWALSRCVGSGSVWRLLGFLPAWLLYWYMRFLLYPMIKRDLRAYEAASINEDEIRALTRASPEKRFPVTAWLMGRYKREERNAAQVAHDFIRALVEATPKMADLFCFVVAELGIRPELCEVLRGEIRDMGKGRVLPTDLNELRMLDSFLRECVRWYLTGDLALHRQLRVPVQLSIGPELPAGANIAVDVHQIPRSEKLWTDPEVFDPMRFYKLRDLPGQEDRHQFTSLGLDNPGWGDGSQACPGRAFADNTMKVALVYLLMNYEFRIPPGGDGPKYFAGGNGSCRPDVRVRIEFRERREDGKGWGITVT